MLPATLSTVYKTEGIRPIIKKPFLFVHLGKRNGDRTLQVFLFKVTVRVTTSLQHNYLSGPDEARTRDPMRDRHVF